MLRISAEFDGDIVKTVSIHGDFFMHPEDALEFIEKAIEGENLGKGLTGAIDRAVEANSIEMFGLDSKGIEDAIKLAKENAK